MQGDKGTYQKEAFDMGRLHSLLLSKEGFLSKEAAHLNNGRIFLLNCLLSPGQRIMRAQDPLFGSSSMTNTDMTVPWNYVPKSSQSGTDLVDVGYGASC